jgi:hypothetical protein
VHVPVCTTQQVPIGGCGHGFVGVQAVGPCTHVDVSVLHWNWKLIAHAPVSVTQHAPGGGMKQIFGEHPPLSVQVLVPVQLAWIVTVHAPSCVQHDPLEGSGHTATVHWAPVVHTLFVPVHCTCAFVEHVPRLTLQHAPCGGITHTLGTHVPSCVQLTLVPMHDACGTTVHAPTSEQHAPLITHGFGGPHPRPAVHTFVPVHDAWKYTTHPPSCVQHVPVGGHGLVAHVAPAMNTPGNEHEVAAAHAPSVVQHAPWACALVALTPSSSIPNTTATRDRIHEEVDLVMGSRRGKELHGKPERRLAGDTSETNASNRSSPAPAPEGWRRCRDGDSKAE